MKQKSEFSTLSRAIQTADGFSVFMKPFVNKLLCNDKVKAIILAIDASAKQGLCKR